MKQICKPSDFLMNVLQFTKNSAGDSCRLLTFCVKVKVDSGCLLYNTLTQELLFLDCHEEDTLLSSDELKQKWCVVAQDFDDFKFARQIRDLMRQTFPKAPTITGYTILPTTDCNARCFYCFELKRPRINMTKDTAETVSSWIIENYMTLCDYDDNNPGVVTNTKDGKPAIHISWFGGEPLYNTPIIDLIATKLREADVNFYSSMTSNGYLFDEDIVAKCSDLWNLKSVQITLDGTEEVYNRCKAFIYKDVNPFQVVIRNIRLLLESNIKVAIRLNIDVHNAKDLLTLVDYLSEEFGKYDNISVYSHPLFEIDGNEIKPRTEARRAEVYQLYQDLEKRIESKGLNKKSRLPKRYTTNKCKADSPNAVIVLPTGHLGRCEHYTDSDYYAHISDISTVDTKMYKSFEEKQDMLPICQDCAYYPQCVPLKKCPDESLCHLEKRDDKIRKLTKSMLYEYELWSSKQSKDNDEDENNVSNQDC